MVVQSAMVLVDGLIPPFPVTDLPFPAKASEQDGKSQDTATALPPTWNQKRQTVYEILVDGSITPC